MSTDVRPQPMSRVSTGRLALLVTLGTESVFFATLLVAYAALRGQVNWDIPHSLSRLAIPLVNTGILLISAVTVWWSSRAIRRGQTAALRKWTAGIGAVGIMFRGRANHRVQPCRAAYR